MPLQDESILHLSQLTASKAPAPGGGAICAMVGAFAAALAAMVAHLTKDKKGYEAVSADMETLIQQADDLQSLLLGDMDRDAASFTDYMQALKLPKETQQQKDERHQALQTALKKATLVPLETGKHIALVFPLARLAVMKGNTTAVTDGLSAAMLARSALRGVLLNVKINLQSIEDEAFVCATAEACRQLESYAEEAEKEALALQPKLQ